ncbi:MAG: hypothetical protein HBSAPP03_19740 [Phycisphaerae bacterium]|nr:MAG: hypothetical protein HBSAPP03_19740 [Phycisphaerae bacterium]
MTTPRWLRNRRVAILAYLAAVGVAAYAVTMPLVWQIEGALDLDKKWGAASAGVVLLYVALHVVFLMPIRKPGAGGSRRPLWWSLAAAGLMIGLLAAGAVLAVGHAVFSLTDGEIPGDKVIWWGTLGVLAGGWLVATPLLIAFTRRGRPEGVVQRVAARLFVGTLVEAAAIIPLDVLVRRKEDCVCATGTYMALSLCGAVGLFVLGPAVLLPLLAKRRRRWYAGHCEVCGYDMTRTPTLDRCPECGSGWKAGEAVPGG